MADPLKTVILGTAGNCIDILDTINELNAAAPEAKYECIGFLDDNQANWGKVILGVKVLGPLDHAGALADAWFVNGIGSPANFWKKEAIIAKTGIAHDRFLTLVHPTASVSRLSHLGHGVVVFQHAAITSNVRVGNHVVILPNSVISHDNSIGDYTCIAGGVCVSGGVNVGKACYLGSNCAIIGNITIGDYSLVGMGSVVLADVPSNTVVAGNPARRLRETRERPGSG